MATEDVQVSVENACNALATGDPALVQKAQQSLIEFRSRPDALSIAMGVLQQSSIPVAQFQMVSAISMRLVQDWSRLDETEKREYLNFFLKYLLDAEKRQITPVVSRAIVGVFAVGIKRGWLEEDPKSNEGRVHLVREWIFDPSHRTLRRYAWPLRVCTALVEEFSCDRATSVGLSLEYHFRCRRSFEKSLLPEIFQFAISFLREISESGGFSRIEQFPDSEVSLVLNLLLTILNWRFEDADPPLSAFRVVRSSIIDSCALKPGASWSVAFVGSGLIELLVSLHGSCVHASDAAGGGQNQKVRVVASLVRQSFTQLCTMDGTVFNGSVPGIGEGQDLRLVFARQLLQALLVVLQHIHAKSPEPERMDPHLMLDVANWFYNLTSNFGRILLSDSPVEGEDVNLLTGHVLQPMVSLTERMINCAVVRLSPDHLEYDVMAETLEFLLDSWTFLCDPYSSSVPPDTHTRLVHAAGRLFDVYTKSILAKGPDDSEKELEEELEDEGVSYNANAGSLVNGNASAQMEAVALLGRFSVLESVKLLTDVATRLVPAFSSVLSGDGADDVRFRVFEEVHALLTLSALLLADAGRDETPAIPDSVNYCSLAASLQNEKDPILSLVSCCFELREIQNVALRNGQVARCSPFIAETFLRFLVRFSRTYLLPEPDSNPNISPALGQEFNAAVVGPVLSSLGLMLEIWEDPLLLLKVCDAFALIVEPKRVRDALVVEAAQFSGSLFSQLVSMNLERKPVAVRRLMTSVLVRIASYKSAPRELLGLILEPVQQRLALVFAEGFERKDSIHSKDAVISCLALLRGIAVGVDLYAVEPVYVFLSSMFDHMVYLAECYSSYGDIILEIILFFLAISEHSLPMLTPARSASFFRAVHSLFVQYSRSMAGAGQWPVAHTAIGVSEEEDRGEHLVRLLQLLSNLLHKSHMDLDDNQCPEAVCFGFVFIVSLVNQPMLDYSPVALEFFGLISLFCTLFAEKLFRNFSADHFASVMTFLEFGMDSSNSRVARMCVDSLESIVKCSLEGNGNEHTKRVLERLMDQVFGFILFKTFDEELINPLANLFFILVWAQQDRYAHLVHGLLSECHEGPARDRIGKSFESLFSNNGIVQSVSPRNRKMFQANMQKFLLEVRGVLNADVQ